MRRREFVHSLAGFASLGLISSCRTMPAVRQRVVVVGGGFGGATCARFLKQMNPALAVTLIEPKQQYVACPFSNLVIGGLRSPALQTFNYASLLDAGIVKLNLSATGVDPEKKRVELGSGDAIFYDRLVLAPGIRLDFAALPGYSQDAINRMPHAWQSGGQMLLLAEQLTAMPDGGTVVMAVPENPYRCPPGPYERASLIAHYLKDHKPRSKVVLLDAKDRFSKQSLFESAWQRFYPGRIEWHGRSDGARVVSVNAADMSLETDFDRVRGDVVNVIPPQKAGLIAERADLTDASGWCPVDAASFASVRHADIHVIGDAAVANAMPKSAFAANAQAKLCALQVTRLLRGEPPVTGKLMNTCYSLVSPDYGISVAGVYRADGSRWAAIDGAGGVSPLVASDEFRSLEADYARSWFSAITREAFG